MSNRSAGSSSGSATALPGVHIVLDRAEELRRRDGNRALTTSDVLSAAAERHPSMLHRLAGSSPLEWDDAAPGRPVSRPTLLAGAAQQATRRGAEFAAEQDLITATLVEHRAGTHTPAVPEPKIDPDPADALTRAIRLEARDPEAAARQYVALAQLNTQSHPGLFMAAVVFPVAAMTLAYLAAPSLPVDMTITAVVIVLLAGYLPPAAMFADRVLAAGVEDNETPLGRLASRLAIAAMLMFEGPLFLLSVIVAYVIAAVPLFVVIAFLSWLVSGTPWSSPDPTLTAVVFTPLFLATFVFALSDVHPRALLRPSIALPEIAAGLRTRAKDALQLFVGLVIGVVLAGAGPMELLYERLDVALAAAAASGILLGLATHRTEREAEVGIMVGLGAVRCAVRTGRVGAARYELGRLADLPRSVQTDIGEDLVACTRALTGGSPGPDAIRRICDRLDAAEASARRRGRPDWAASAAATRALASDLDGLIPGTRR